MSSSKPSKHSDRKKARQEERDSKKHGKSESPGAPTQLALRPHPQQQKQVSTSNVQMQSPAPYGPTQMHWPQLPYTARQSGSQMHTTTTTTTTTTTSGGHQTQPAVQSPQPLPVQHYPSTSSGQTTHASQQRVSQPMQKSVQQPSARQHTIQPSGQSSYVAPQPVQKPVRKADQPQASHSTTHSHTSRQVSNRTQPAPMPAPARAAPQIAYGYDYSWQTYVPGQIIELPAQQYGNQVSTMTTTSSTQSQNSNAIAQQQAAQLEAARLQASQEQAAALQAAREQAAREQAARDRAAQLQAQTLQAQQLQAQQLQAQQLQAQQLQAQQQQAQQQQAYQQQVEQQRVYQQTIGGEARKTAAIQGQTYLAQFDQRVQQMLISASSSECESGARYYPMSAGYLCGIGNHFISHQAVDEMMKYGKTPEVEYVNSAIDEDLGCRHVIPPADGWLEPMHWDPERRDRAGMIIMRYRYDGSQWDLSRYERDFAYQRATGAVDAPDAA